MKPLVVGSRGTLGARLVTELDADGIDFRAGDALSSRDLERLGQADFVINVGGPRVRSELGALDYFREHVGVAQRVVRTMKRGAHLVHASSTAVFGARGVELASDSEEAPDRFPMPAYAAAKLAAETYVRASAPERGIGLTVLRPSMVYGENVDSALESLRRLAGRGIRLDLRPSAVRQHLLHIDLLVAILRRAHGRGPTGSKPLNVADPFVLTNADLDRMLRETKSPFPFSAKAAIPIPLSPLAFVQERARRSEWSSLALDSFAVLALDNVFSVRETFRAFDIDEASFGRAATFDRAFARTGLDANGHPNANGAVR